MKSVMKNTCKNCFIYGSTLTRDDVSGKAIFTVDFNFRLMSGIFCIEADCIVCDNCYCMFHLQTTYI